MALEFTATAELLSEKDNIQQQIILEIDGFSLIFAAIRVTKLARYGDDGLVYGLPGLVYGGTIDDPNSRPYISLEGTTRSIKQQIEPTRAGATSIQSFNVRLVDKDQELTRIFSPGNTVDDILSRDANVYMAFRGGSHPEDSILILQGNIDQARFGAGHVDLKISHAENLKRSIVLPLVRTELTSGIGAADVIIPVTTTNNFVFPQDALRSFIRIDDELIEVSGGTTSSFSVLQRGALGTTAAIHDPATDVESFYRLTGEPMDLALKLMLSNGGLPFKEDIEIPNFVQVDPLTNTPNGIFISDVDFTRRYGITVGDTVTITGALNPANNVTDAPIAQININANGTVYVLSGVSLTSEVDSDALASFTSQYNTLPEGSGADISPSQVDVERHIFWTTTFPSTFPTLEIDVKDDVNLKDFINEQIYFPCGFFPVPRKGRISVNYNIPPILDNQSVEINESNVSKPQGLKILRSTNNDFFNAVVYKYEKDPIEDDFLKVNITQSARSTNRIRTRNKPLEINADGFRDNTFTNDFIDKQTRRFLDRYQFGAESIDVETSFKTAKVEVGDSVIFRASNLKVTDIKNETRDFAPRIMEVVNKDISLTTGRVKMRLSDTAFGVDARYGVFSPSSFVGPGATIATVPIKSSFNTQPGQDEETKWFQYVGEDIEIHNPDYSTYITATFIGFDPGTPNVMLVSGMSAIPTEDLVVDIPKYPVGTDSREDDIYKAVHCYSNPEVVIVSGIDNFSFNVSLADADLFQLGLPIRVHDADYSVDSTPNVTFDDAVVTDVTGTVVTVDRDLGFTPSVGQLVNLIGYEDGGQPYRYF